MWSFIVSRRNGNFWRQSGPHYAGRICPLSSPAILKTDCPQWVHLSHSQPRAEMTACGAQLTLDCLVNFALATVPRTGDYPVSALSQRIRGHVLCDQQPANT